VSEEQKEKLIEFAIWAIEEHKENGDIDGFSAQDTLTDLGLLEIHKPDQPCEGRCDCLEGWGMADFEARSVECYRFPEWLSIAILKRNP
jgi:hypothetical protein